MIKSKLSSQKEFIQKTTLKKLKIVGEIKNLYTFAHSFLREKVLNNKLVIKTTTL